jgi:nicotinamide mononucleotide transporter
VFLTLAISILLGIIFDDYIWGSLTLIFGFLNSYYMAIGKWQNYIFGILFTITYTYICAINGMYGWLIFSLIFYLPVQIYVIVNWFKNKEDEQVQMKSFTWKNSLIICSLVILGSTLLGFLLSLIPNQNLAFLDSTSQIINICGVVLVAIRFRECWYVWLANNIIDLSIWIVNIIKHTPNSEMALITSIMYLVMNIIGVICWVVIERRQKKTSLNSHSEC